MTDSSMNSEEKITPDTVWVEKVPLLDQIPRSILMLFVLAVVVCLWQIATAFNLVSSIVLPTPGETFRDILEDLTDGHLQRDYGDRPLSPLTLRQRVRLATSRPHLEPGTRAVHGHFIATKYWRRYPEARYMAWFREPVERLARKQADGVVVEDQSGRRRAVPQMERTHEAQVLRVAFWPTA